MGSGRRGKGAINNEQGTVNREQRYAATFSRACYKTNRVLEQAQLFCGGVVSAGLLGWRK
jgi:hypothetical protein